jgi:hypothetical protein
MTKGVDAQPWVPVICPYCKDRTGENIYEIPCPLDPESELEDGTKALYKSYEHRGCKAREEAK